MAPSSRNECSDGSLSPLISSPCDFPELSPTFNIYRTSLSTFKSGSLDSNQSQSSNSGTESIRDKRLVFGERGPSATRTSSGKKFVNIVNKHAVTILAAASFKLSHEKNTKKKLTVSCPNLINDRKPELHKRLVNGTGSFSDLGSFERQNSRKLSGFSKNKLTVPDIFTTSFTHSKDTSAVSQDSACRHDTTTTTQSTRPTEKPKANRVPLTKTNSVDVNTLRLLSPDMYRDEQIAQVTDYMFVGCIESAHNERKLCRLEIESLVDISNLSEMQIPAHKKLQCPCLCPTESKHFRSRLIIAVPNEENDAIDQYFDEVNKFIEGARRCSKKVLVYSFEGKSRAPLFAIQYLMSFEGLLLRQAYSMIKKQWPHVSLNPSFQRCLEKLEKSLYPDERHSVNICNEYFNVADPQAIKCAWIDC